jgi:hypothetical protein
MVEFRPSILVLAVLGICLNFSGLAQGAHCIIISLERMSLRFSYKFELAMLHFAIAPWRTTSSGTNYWSTMSFYL